MAQRGGELAAKAAKPSGDAAGEDRLSALPDDLLVLILLHLDDTAEAIRTSYFSRRWRRVWTLLPVLRFDLLPEVNGVAIRRILDAPEEAAPLRWISVTTLDAGPESAAAWLPVAARRLSGELNYQNLRVKMNDRDDEDLQPPCFEKATTIKLDIGFLGLALPPHGIFGRLTELFLWRVRFRSPSDLGGVVSSPRCPCLKKLEVSNSRGLQELSIHSESLVRLKLEVVRGLRHLTIMAPILQKLGVVRCILVHDSTESVANISAPQLVDLDWKDFYDPQYVHLGDFEELQQLAPFCFVAYGPPDIRDKNQYCLSLLQRFQALYCLHLTLMYRQDMNEFQYLMGDITVLPQITLLELVVVNEGHAHHAFGASSFHLLRMCTGLRSLHLHVSTNLILEVQSTCPSACICDQPMNWKAEELVLNHLHFVMIVGLHGADHEVTFLKQLFNWATVLTKMTIVFDCRISESKAREFSRALEGSSRPETSVEVHIYHDASKRTTYLLAPEGHDTML